MPPHTERERPTTLSQYPLTGRSFPKGKFLVSQLHSQKRPQPPNTHNKPRYARWNWIRGSAVSVVGSRERARQEERTQQSKASAKQSEADTEISQRKKTRRRRADTRTWLVFFWRVSVQRHVNIFDARNGDSKSPSRRRSIRARSPVGSQTTRGTPPVSDGLLGHAAPSIIDFLPAFGPKPGLLVRTTARCRRSILSPERSFHLAP